MFSSKIKLSVLGLVLFVFVGCTNMYDPNPKPKSTLPFSEKFDTSIGNFTAVNVLGEQVWSFSAQHQAVNMSGFVNPTNFANEDWLISPEIDLTNIDSAKLTFDYVTRYFDALPTDATVWISENYQTGEPTTATWTQLVTPPFVNATAWDFISSGEIDLNPWVKKKIRIAFKYTSTTTRAGTWRIKNFLVQEGNAKAPVPVDGLQLCGDLTETVTSLVENFDAVVNNSNIALPGWKVVQVHGDRNWQGRVFTSGTATENYAQATAHNGAAANYEYWLITPPLNVTAAASKILSFRTAKAFWTSTSSLRVFVLQCNGTTTTRTEITTANIVKESDADHVFVPSGNIDLSTFSGRIYIGFQYIALGGASNSTTFRIDDVWFNNTVTTVAINSTAPTSAVIGQVYSYPITTNIHNPSGNTSITATGLPAWATLVDNNNGTATISGTPTEAGTHAIVITATNNAITATQNYTLTVTRPLALGENLLRNGSFEEWTGTNPNHWTLLSTTVTGVVNVAETSLVSHGTQAFRLNAAASSGTVNWSQIVDVTAGKRYQLSMSYHIVSGDGTDARIWSNFRRGATTFFTETELQATNLYSLLRGPGNTSSSGSLYFPDVKGVWHTYTITFTVPEGATAFDFQFRTYRTATVIWDNFSLVEIVQ